MDTSESDYSYRRGSQSSDGSSRGSSFRLGSNFRERLSSSSSSSGDGNGSSLAMDARIHGYESSQHSSRNKILPMARQYLQIRRYIKNFDRDADREGVVAALLRLPLGLAGESIVKKFCKTSQGRLPRMETLMFMADWMPETEDRPLLRYHNVARLLDMVIGSPKAVPGLTTLLADSSNSLGSAALRYLLRWQPSVLHRAGSLLPFVRRALQASVSQYNFMPPRQAFRLLEYMLRSDYVQLADLDITVFGFVIKGLEDTNSRLSVLHLIRAMEGPASNTMAHFAIEVFPNVEFLVFHDRVWDVRRVAVSAMVVLVPFQQNLPRNVLETVVDMVLWKKDWQHGVSKALKIWDVPPIVPHDDAYSILAAYSWREGYSVSEVTSLFQSRISDAGKAEYHNPRVSCGPYS